MAQQLKFSKVIHTISRQLIYALLFASCVTPVDIKTTRIGGRLAISGQISTIKDQNIIELGRTADESRIPFPLSGASIKLLDNSGQAYIFTEGIYRPGVYTLSQFSGIPGKTYHIQINISSSEVYESAFEQMAQSVGKVSTRYEAKYEEFIDSEGTLLTQPFLKVYANAELPPNNYIKWNVWEDFLLSPTDFPDPFGYTPPPCFISQNADPQRVTLFNGVELKASSTSNLLLSSRLFDYSFFERHYFTTYQSSMTKEAYEYWRQLNILANQTGSIFDTPPAEITGNIHNVNDPTEKVYGYFQAVNQTFDRFYTLKEDLPFRSTWTTCTYADERNYSTYPPRCLECLTVRNSTYNRPTWF